MSARDIDATVHRPAVSPLAVVTLHPGGVACVGRGERMETLLGSCVAIILTDPRRTVGAMCHIVHASAPTAASPLAAAHAGVALETMYRLLSARGIAPRLCDAYVYGGGNMFPGLVSGSHVGQSNVSWVLDALADDGIDIVSRDLGGNVYRRLGWTVGPTPPHVTSMEV